MRIWILGLFLGTACVTINETEHFLKPDGEIVSCYPDSNDTVDLGMLGVAADISGMSSGDRELREKTSQRMDKRSKENSAYQHCKDNAELNGWQRMTRQDIEAKRKQ